MENLPKHAGGRPTKYKEEYCEEIVQFMAQGFSMTAFAGSIGVGRQTITDWANEHEEFSLSVKRGKAACALWWEMVAQKGALGGEANPTLCIFGLKNMAKDDWSDTVKGEFTGKDGGAIKTESTFTIEQIKAITDKANELKNEY